MLTASGGVFGGRAEPALAVTTPNIGAGASAALAAEPSLGRQSQPYKMIQENIWQRTDPGTLWHPGVQEHGREGSRGGGGSHRKSISTCPLPSNSLIHTLFLDQSLSHTHTTPANIISSFDRWERSDLVENQAANLHPYYTVIPARSQTCKNLGTRCTAGATVMLHGTPPA